MTLQEDVEWLCSVCKKPDKLSYLEPTAHAFSIFFALKNDNTYEKIELMKLSMVGILATMAKMNNEEKFHTIHPQAFLQLANMFIDEEDNGERYNQLISKLTGQSLINIPKEGTPNE